MIQIAIKISAGKKMCDDCEYLTIFHTGLVGEFHPMCDIFDEVYGEWGERNMKRAKACLAAEKRSSKGGER